MAAVKQAYWTLKALRANVTVQERSLQLAEQLAKDNGVRVRLGQAPPIDLVQADAEVAERRENLIRARAAADDGEDRLRRLIMDPGDASFWQVRLETTDDGLLAVPNGPQASHIVTSLLGADALAMIAPGSGTAEPGERVPLIKLSGWRSPR